MAFGEIKNFKAPCTWSYFPNFEGILPLSMYVSFLSSKKVNNLQRAPCISFTKKLACVPSKIQTYPSVPGKREFWEIVFHLLKEEEGVDLGNDKPGDCYLQT